VPQATWPTPQGHDVDGPLRVGIRSSPLGLIADLKIGDTPWFEVRQESFERAEIHVYDWGDYFSMSIDANGHRIGFQDAWNYDLDWVRARLQGGEQC
jgi:hypothetical protein